MKEEIIGHGEYNSKSTLPDSFIVKKESSEKRDSYLNHIETLLKDKDYFNVNAGMSDCTYVGVVRWYNKSLGLKCITKVGFYENNLPKQIEIITLQDFFTLYV